MNYLSAPALLSALGSGIEAHLQGLLNPPPTSPLRFSDSWIAGKSFPFAAVSQPLRDFPADLPAIHHSCNNQLLWTALAQIEPQIHAAVERYGAHRVAAIIGTSTSGVDENLALFTHAAATGDWHSIPFAQQQQSFSAPADFVAEVYGLTAPHYGISTACTSGARALISAARLLNIGACDVVICGGVDTLSVLTINGFHALEVLSAQIARPFAAARDGINIGEAAAVFVMSRDAATGLPLLAYGASSDAHHMSSPQPEGLGAIRAFKAALAQGNLQAADIAWINLHGTGTPLNDSMESLAIAEVFGNQTAVTATKTLTGHTLGAAGALEAGLLWIIVSRQYNPAGRLPPQINAADDCSLPPLAFTHADSHWQRARRIGASSSFAFGGNNSVIVIGEAPC